MAIRTPAAFWPSCCLALLIAGSAPGSRAVFAQEGEAATRRAAVDAIFEQWDDTTSPGCAVGVYRDGDLLHARGYGMSDLAHGLVLTPRSVFHVASLSKQFTAFAVGLLVQRGMVSWDDDVRSYVPEVPDFGRRITLRHLVHHTSGLRDAWGLLDLAGWRDGAFVTQDDVLALVARQRDLDFAPGEDYQYSNTGYSLLAEVVERVTGQSFREFAEENIFEPLGMADTHFHDDVTHVVPDRTSAYFPGPGGTWRTLLPWFHDVVGPTNLMTTVLDLRAWDANLGTGAVGGEAVVRELQTAGTLSNGTSVDYAGGLVIGSYRGLPTVSHSGWDETYRAHYLRFPEQRFAVACLCNVSSANSAELARQVADVFLAEELSTDRPDVATRAEAVSLGADQLAARAGLYWNPTHDYTREISFEDGKLLSRGQEMVPVAQDRHTTVGVETVDFTFEPPEGAPERLYLEVRGSGTRTTYERVEPARPDEHALRTYEACYYSFELDVIYRAAVDENGRLVLRRSWRTDRTLAPLFADAFTFSGNGVLRFVRGDEGGIEGFLLSWARPRQLAFDAVRCPDSAATEQPAD